MIKHELKILFLILVLATFLRFWGLGTTPPHLTSDEAALGYNAYSILKTARDEHGNLLPIVFKSFGDWKPGLYVYLDAPFVGLFGLNEMAVRLPGAISGIAAVFFVYLVGNRLFPEKKLGLFSSFFLAISPWHLQFSRGAWEAGVALTLILAGIYFFLRAIQGNSRWLWLSASFFALTLWAYQGGKLSVAIVIAGLSIFFFSELIKVPRKVLMLAFLAGFIFSLPVALSFFQGKTGRLEVYSVFSYQRPEKDIKEILDQESAVKGSLSYVLFHSENLNLARGVLGRWMNYYSARFLFFEGDWSNPRHGVPYSGVLLLADSVLLLLGLVALSKAGNSKSALFVWYLLLLSSLPAALSRDSIHAVRSLNMLFPLVFILALGASFVVENKKKLKFAFPLLLGLFFVIYAANYTYYLDQYWVHAPKKNAPNWQVGYKQMVEKVSALQDKYPEIVIKQDYAQPYIFFLFYQKYDPDKYQKIAQDVYVPNEYGDVGFVSRLDNITFRDINWSADRGMSGKLFVVDPIKVPVADSSDPKEFKLVDEIKYPNGQTAFRLLEIL